MRNTHFITQSKNAQCALRKAHFIPTIGGMKTGKIIRELRKQKKLTLSEVESRAGLSDGNLSRIERSEQWLSEEKLIAVAEALGVTTAELFMPPGSNKVRDTQIEAPTDPDLARVEINEVMQLISLFGQSTIEGRKFILRSARGAKKIDNSLRDASTSN